MCTSFVYRKNDIFIGMNFDNNGKECFVSLNEGNDFIVNTKVNKIVFPSFGITKNKTFFNDLMVDSIDAGKYKRQTDKRWVTSTLLKEVINHNMDLESICRKLNEVVIVNNPNSSTHNMIVDHNGKICVIEPGRKVLISSADNTGFYTMTNFPLSDYDEFQPEVVSGSGSDRYLLVNKLLNKYSDFSEIVGLEVLKAASQKGPEWNTDLSLIYNTEMDKMYFCLHNDYETIYEYDFKEEIIKNKTTNKKHVLSKNGISFNELVNIL